MILRNKFILIAVAAILGAVGYVFYSTFKNSLPQASGVQLASSLKWLAIIGVFYVANFLLAWRYRKSWPVTMGRTLTWAFVAYICISNIVDVLGLHRNIAWQIMGEEGGGDPVLIEGLRAQVVVWALSLVLSVVCIAIGFEQRTLKAHGAGDSEDKSN